MIAQLFETGTFHLHSGAVSQFRIDCDALSYDDMQAIAAVLAGFLPPFGTVEGVPRGGLRLASALQRYVTPSQKRQGVSGAKELLIVDDVLTTGQSMEEQRAGRDAIGAVIFARGQCPDWIGALFAMPCQPPYC